MLLQALHIISYPLVNSNWSYSPETPNLGQIRRFLEPRDLVIWRMTLRNNRAPLLCYFKLCAAFRSHWWIQTEVTVRKRPIRVKFDYFLSRVSLKFDVWPWKTKGHLFYVTSSFVQHFVPIGEFKLELQSGNAQSGSNSTIFIEPCDLEIWRITLKNNRAPLLCYFKLCVAFHSHWWIWTGVTVRKRPIWVNSTIFSAEWPCNSTDDLEKQKGTSPKQHQAICIISSSYMNSNRSYSPETAKLGCDLCDLGLWPLTSDLDLLHRRFPGPW